MTELEYTKSILAGLLSFSQRSGAVEDGCDTCADKSPKHGCRCGYEYALQIAIRCVDAEMEREEAVKPPQESEQ